MADVTYYLALPFGTGDDGPEPREAVVDMEKASKGETPV